MKTKISLLLVLISTFFQTIQTAPWEADAAAGTLEDKALQPWKKPLPDFDEGLGELMAANKAIATHKGKERGIVTAGAVSVIYGISKAGLAQAYFPYLFPRSGTSTAIAWTIGGIVVSGSAWVGISYARSLFALGDAHADLQKALAEIGKTSAALADLQANHARFTEVQGEMAEKLTEAKINAFAAKQSMQGAEHDLQEFIKTLELNDGKHAQVVTMLVKRVNDLEGLTQELTLDKLREKATDGPQLDDLARMAQDLEAKTGLFAKRDDIQKNMATAAEAVVTHKKKRGFLKSWL